VSLFGGYAHPWLLAGFVLVWRGIQDYACVPLIMGRGIEIHPVLVIAGVLAGGEIAGVAGMFLSVPVIAAARIVWRRLQSGAARPVDDLTLNGTVTSPRGDGRSPADQRTPSDRSDAVGELGHGVRQIDCVGRLGQVLVVAGSQGAVTVLRPHVGCQRESRHAPTLFRR
jgi:AI-2E family transporter